MSSAVITDPQRLAALEATGLLDSPPEEIFDRLTRLASRNLHAPVTLLSLADDRRQFFKSARGLPEPWASLRLTPLSNSLCEQVIAAGKPVVLCDVRQDPLGHVSREVGDLHIVAYLGVPLVTSDRQTLGSFCVADFEPRDWSTDEIETLSELAATAAHEIVLRNTAMELEDCVANYERQTNALRFTTGERLRLALSAARAGVAEWDLVSGRMYWSPEMYGLLGCDKAAGPMDAAEFLTRLVHRDDRGHVQFIITNMVAGGEGGRSLDSEFRIIRPDGATVWVSSIGYVEQDESGRPIRGLVILRDITTRKRAEREKQERAQFIQKMAAVTPDLIYVFDRDERRRIYGNRSLSEVLGYGNTPAQDEPALADRVMHPDDRERAIAFRRSVKNLEDHAVAELECRYRRADGTWGWFLVRSAVFARNADGSVRQLFGTTTEITAIKRAESELLRLNAELEQRVAARTEQLSIANRELESFAYSVSHDLRAPLRAINSFSRLIFERCGEQFDAVSLRYQGQVHAAAQRMGELIDALLSLSRVTRGPLSRQRVNMSALARSITTELGRAEPERDVEIAIAEDVTGTGDPVLLRIVLQNLLGNAWKYTSGREQAHIEFGVQCTQKSPIFFIRDNGVGFDMECSARLFSPFQRLHTAEEFPGIGIGLATVQRIITRHDGRIWAESAPGKGATFYFTLGGGSGS